MTTRLDQLDYAAKLICEADSLIREALGQNNFVSPRVSDVLDYIGEEMAEIESEDE